MLIEKVLDIPPALFGPNVTYRRITMRCVIVLASTLENWWVPVTVLPLIWNRFSFCIGNPPIHITQKCLDEEPDQI